MMDDVDELLALYRRNPCRTLPNAFWKTVSVPDEVRLDCRRDAAGRVVRHMVWQGERLMAYWQDPSLGAVPAEVDPSGTPFALVHADARSVFEQSRLRPRQAYFRLVHRGDPPASGCPEGFYFAAVDPQKEAGEVVRVIQSCYANMNVSDKIVLSWQDHPVYDPDLWVWVVQKDSRRKAALGIAEWDAAVPEVSLEWIQVLPDFRRKGLGRAVVNELLRRSSGRSDFVTVSGEADNTSRPDLLYRACGFKGSDLWWLMTADTLSN
jgi:ribosomal protein S18 acetylase RimI-like enzyme